MELIGVLADLAGGKDAVPHFAGLDAGSFGGKAAGLARLAASGMPSAGGSTERGPASGKRSWKPQAMEASWNAGSFWPWPRPPGAWPANGSRISTSNGL